MTTYIFRNIRLSLAFSTNFENNRLEKFFSNEKYQSLISMCLGLLVGLLFGLLPEIAPLNFWYSLDVKSSNGNEQQPNLAGVYIYMVFSSINIILLIFCHRMSWNILKEYGISIEIGFVLCWLIFINDFSIAADLIYTNKLQSDFEC